MLADILAGLFGGVHTEHIPAFDAENATARLADGLPLLRSVSGSLDPSRLRERYLHVCGVVQRHQSDNGDAARGLDDAVRRGRLEPVELLQEFLAGRPEAIHARAAALELDAELVVSTLRLSAMPGLAQFNAALESLRSTCAWERGYCPSCGSRPLLGEFRGLEQTRWLRCGFCAAAWVFPRLRCPFCDTQDHHLLGFFHVEGQESKYRAATCDHCHRYVKMISTLELLSAPQLLVADLATVHLDLAAPERGFQI
jgi:FdhE protein